MFVCLNRCERSDVWSSYGTPRHHQCLRENEYLPGSDLGSNLQILACTDESRYIVSNSFVASFAHWSLKLFILLQDQGYLCPFTLSWVLLLHLLTVFTWLIAFLHFFIFYFSVSLVKETKLKMQTFLYSIFQIHCSDKSRMIWFFGQKGERGVLENPFHSIWICLKPLQTVCVVHYLIKFHEKKYVMDPRHHYFTIVAFHVKNTAGCIHLSFWWIEMCYSLFFVSRGSHPFKHIFVVCSQ